jgi:predicted lipoprotein with Yx(FWY)xxD motif
MRRLLKPLAAVAGVAIALLVGIAFATSFTLRVAKNATVKNQMGGTKHENIAVASNGRATYTLTGDSKSHPECTAKNHCYMFWPPLAIPAGAKPSKATGIPGKLTIWHHNGFFQVVLGGHPLYEYSGDSKAHVATGEGIVSFGGTWHVVKANASGGGTTSTGSTSTTTTTSTTPCLYPPCP